MCFCTPAFRASRDRCTTSTSPDGEALRNSPKPKPIELNELDSFEPSKEQGTNVVHELGHMFAFRLTGKGDGGGGTNPEVEGGGAQKKPQVCRFYAKGTCRLGDKCTFQHQTPAAHAAESACKAGGKGGSGPGPGAEGGRSDCRRWMKEGECRFGDRSMMR